MPPVVPFGDGMGPSKEDLVHEFGVKCNASPEQALHYLEAYDWDFRMACEEFLRDTDQATVSPSNPPEQVPGYALGYVPEYTGPRTLDGRPAPQSESSSKAKGQSKSRPKRTGIATLGSLGGSNDDGNDDSDETDHDDGRGNLFAGGEKSGLAVQDPNQQESGPRKIINDILAKAKANASRPEPTAQRADAPGPSRFHGTGVTLGGEGVESRSIPGSAGASTASGSPQERLLHIWRDGFSIDDGELHRFDDPANQADLQMIRSGRAPLHLMNVESDQPVDVKLHQHDTPYKPPPKKYKPFSGSGQRLGSIVPGLGSSSSTAESDTSATAAAPSLSATPATATTAAASREPATDPLQPTIMIRIQMPDGTRLPARFNTTDTIEDIYRFVRGASTETSSRSWVLATTFPNKEHSDQSLVLADVPEFKKGGTAVVKWAA